MGFFDLVSKIFDGPPIEYIAENMDLFENEVIWVNGSRYPSIGKHIKTEKINFHHQGTIFIPHDGTLEKSLMNDFVGVVNKYFSGNIVYEKYYCKNCKVQRDSNRIELTGYFKNVNDKWIMVSDCEDADYYANIRFKVIFKGRELGNKDIYYAFNNPLEQLGGAPYIGTGGTGNGTGLY